MELKEVKFHVEIKFRIPFCRMAVARLNNGQKNCVPFGKKRPFHSSGVTILIFFVHHTPRSKKL